MKPLKRIFASATLGLAALGAQASEGSEATFPVLRTAEEVLVGKGFSPEQARTIVEKTAGTRAVRMLGMDDLGTLGRALRQHASEIKKESGTVATQYNMMAADVERLDLEISATRSIADTLPVNLLNKSFLNQLSPAHAKMVKGECYIRIDETRDPLDLVSEYFSGVPRAFIETGVISRKDLMLLTLAHELRHCNPHNHANMEMREIDADLAAVGLAKELGIDRKSAETLALLRTLRPSFSVYSSGLSIDAKLRGETPPTFEEIGNVYRDINPIFREKMARMDRREIARTPFFLTAARIFNDVLQDDSMTLSPLTRRFMELTIAGAQLIAPKKTAEVMQKREPRTP